MSYNGCHPQRRVAAVVCAGLMAAGLAFAGLALAVLTGSARAETTPPQPAAPQPSLPQQMPGLKSVDIDTLGGPDSGIGPSPRRRHVLHHRRVRAYAHRYGDRLAHVERPALAGVELVAPLPRPRQPPHGVVPVPAYPFENAVTALTTPPPPVVCHPARRDPYAPEPDPKLYRQAAVACEADNP